MSTLPIHSMGGLLKSEVELLVVNKAEDLQRGYEAMLDSKLEQNKQALDERLDSQDAAINDVKGIVTDSNHSIKQLCEKHEQWHDADLTWRNSVDREIGNLKGQVKAIRVFIAFCSAVVKTSKYIFENGDKAGGLTMKVILVFVTYLVGQSLYTKWLSNLLHMWFVKGH